MLLESKIVQVPYYADVDVVDKNNHPVKWTIEYFDVKYDARGRPMLWKDQFGWTHQFRKTTNFCRFCISFIIRHKNTILMFNRNIIILL